jgi:hypothetical protein
MPSRGAVALFTFVLSYDPVGAQHSGSDDNGTRAHQTCRYVPHIPELDRDCAALEAKYEVKPSSSRLAKEPDMTLEYHMAVPPEDVATALGMPSRR